MSRVQYCIGLKDHPRKKLGACLPDKAKFTVCSIIKLATIGFDETSSYWSAPKSS